ncbi:hypothetical protein JB92DRAFT_2825899 [Gautieria morchelliformis]|nr:hypothetical protein JB92DRAFT_2825899 [Gautieria morchelliformis]
MLSYLQLPPSTYSTEKFIQNAYLQLIQAAHHYIYIALCMVPEVYDANDKHGVQRINFSLKSSSFCILHCVMYHSISNKQESGPVKNLSQRRSWRRDRQRSKVTSDEGAMKDILTAHWCTINHSIYEEIEA